MLTAEAGGNFGGNGGSPEGAQNLLNSHGRSIIQPDGVPVTLEINRLTATTADFNAYGPDHHVLGTRKLTFDPVTDDLFVSLVAHDTTGRFDNVGITAVPLPPALATTPLVMAALGAGMWWCRRRHAPARAE